MMATQNPIEQEGTYPLPEAQLDRFLLKLVVGYSTRDELSTILDRTTRGERPRAEKVLDGETLIRASGPGPRRDHRPSRSGLRDPAGAGHASPRTVRCADVTNQVHSLGQQPPRRPDAGPGRQGSSLSGLAATTSASKTCAASIFPSSAPPRLAQLRGPGRGDRSRRGLAQGARRGSRKGGGNGRRRRDLDRDRRLIGRPECTTSTIRRRLPTGLRCRPSPSR